MTNQPFCVYEHWVDNKCIYVGSGRLDRPYLYRAKNKKWQNYFPDTKEWIKLRNDTVKILKTFSDREEAYEFEKETSIKRRQEGHPLTTDFDGRSNPGKANGFYGKKHKKESLEKARKKHLVNNKGSNNPMHGKRAALSEWTYLYKDGEFIKEFESFKKCRMWIKENIKGYPMKSLFNMKKTGEPYKTSMKKYKKYEGYKIICSKERLL